MHINTFFQRIPDAPECEAILPYWRASWRFHEWTPRVFGLSFAENHPKFKELAAHVSKFPTVNNPIYEKLCWLRWLCAASMYSQDWTLWCDTDVINRNMPAIDFSEAIRSRSLAYPAHYFCAEDFKSPVTGILSISRAFVTRYLIDGVLALDPANLPGEIVVNGQRHFSDMLWFGQLASNGLLQYIKADIGYPNLSAMPAIVHCAYNECLSLGRKKLDVIKELTNQNT
jgi:hypothetical protein